MLEMLSYFSAFDLRILPTRRTHFLFSNIMQPKI